MASEEGSLLDWESTPDEFRKEYKSVVEELKAERTEKETLSGRVAQIDRKEKFEELKKLLGDEAADVSLEDLGDIPIEQISDLAIKVKAQEKAQKKAQLLDEQATAAGFESVEEFQTALNKAKELKAQERADLGTQADVAASGQGAPVPPKPVETQAWEKLQEAKNKGANQEDQQRAYIGQKLAAALEEPPSSSA